MSITRHLLAIAVGFLFIVGAGCQPSDSIVQYEKGGEDANLICTCYRAVDCMLDSMPECTAMNPAKKVLVATAVNLDNLDTTSSFGRLVGEFVAARMTKCGFSVVNVNIRQGSIAINENGQFVLSRNIQKLAGNYDTGSVLVTTYSRAPEKIFVSLKWVNAEASTVVGAADFAIPAGPQAMALLGFSGGAKRDGTLINRYY